MKHSFGVFRIAFAYIGTVIGAGFASGQEILLFFGAYGWAGLAGAAVSVLLFFFIGYSVLLLGHALRAQSHLQVIRRVNGMLLGSLIDIVITVFLFGGLAAMIAGSGAIFFEQFHISPIWGTLLMAAASLVTVITGLKGVITAISNIAPFLIGSVLLICIYSLSVNPITGRDIATAAAQSGATPNWLLSAVNYASYNMAVAIAVLTPMGAAASSRRTLFWGALVGAAGLGLGIAGIYLCVVTNISDVTIVEVPMIEIARRISPLVQLFFAAVLFAQVYTTAVGNLYGFVHRISPGRADKWVIVGVTALALIAGQLGFSNMIRYLYPAVGYGGLIFFAGIGRLWLKKRDAFG